MSERFDSWIREAGDFPPPDGVKKEAHLAVLKNRLRARRRRKMRHRRIMGVAAAAVLALALIGYGQFKQAGIPAAETQMAQAPSASVHADSLQVHTPQRMAGIPDLQPNRAQRLLAVSFGDRNWWAMECRASILGRPIRWLRPVGGLNSAQDAEMAAFIAGEGGRRIGRILAGGIPVDGLEEISLAGGTYILKVYKFSTDRFGPATFMVGFATRTADGSEG